MNAKSIHALLTLAIMTCANWSTAADRIIGVQSARVMSQSMPKEGWCVELF
jgi:hypothetical protein